MVKSNTRSRAAQRPARRPELQPADVEAALARVRGYAAPYRALMAEAQQGLHLEQMLAGLTSNLERKSIEPIALMHDLPRHHLQHFVGASPWDEQPLRQLQWKEVSAEIGTKDGALVIDGSSTPKKGTATVGVARQWCGRLGKIDSCVIGVYGVYVGQQGLSTLVDSQLYLPKEWVKDKARRTKAKIPPKESYKTQPELAMEMVHRLSEVLPFSWVLGDDEFGKVRDFRDLCFECGKSYVLDVPENTAVTRVKKSGKLGKKSWSAKELVRSRPRDEWVELTMREGEKGPQVVWALALPVATGRPKGGPVKETLLVIETQDKSQRWYCLARTQSETSLLELVRRAGQRHQVEVVFEEAKGEVGLDHFEVRSWRGWHHHMTLCQLAHWFLVREKKRLGEKSPRADSELDPTGAGAVAEPAAERRAKRPPGELSPQPQPRGQRSPLPRPRPTTASSASAR